MTKNFLNRAAAAMTAIAGAAVFTFSTFAAYGYSEDVVSSAKFDPDIYDIILYEFDADDSGDSLTYIRSFQSYVLQEVVGLTVVVDGLGEGGPESGAGHGGWYPQRR